MNDKLIQIGGKSYQKCSVVMLPTDKAENAILSLELRGGRNLEYHGRKYFTQEYLKSIDLKSYHLYILSSEEIKEGDWYIKNNSSIHQSAGGEIEKGDYKNCKKIIATTDILLTDYVKVEGGFGSYNKVPRTSDDFIKAFVKAQGAIKEVFVEYEEI